MSRFVAIITISGSIVFLLFIIGFFVMKKNVNYNNYTKPLEYEHLVNNTKPLDNCCLFNKTMSKYRLGDMIRGNLRDEEGGKKWHIKTYPNSIVTEYFRRTNKKNDINVVKDIIKQKLQYISPIDGIAIHLRTGDVIEDDPHSVHDFISFPIYYRPDKHWSQYVSCWPLLKEELMNIPPNINNVTIFASSHVNKKTNKSCLYLAVIKKLLINNCYTVNMRLGQDPDEDVILMSTAPYFIQSGGGYSKVIKDIRNKFKLPSFQATK